MYTEDQLTYMIRSAMFEVQKELGPGLLESVYEEALVLELEAKGLKVERQLECPVYYKGCKLSSKFRIDLLVNDRVIVELKSVETLDRVHYKQLLNYLRITNLHVGLLVNFNSATLDGTNLRRVYNNAESVGYAESV